MIDIRCQKGFRPLDYLENLWVDFPSHLIGYNIIGRREVIRVRFLRDLYEYESLGDTTYDKAFHFPEKSSCFGFMRDYYSEYLIAGFKGKAYYRKVLGI